MKTEILLSADQITKSYAGKLAVKGISLNLLKGQCLGLLGPNGAGKTTTFEMLEGIKKPDSGTILFKGKPLGKHFSEKVGILFQHTALPERLTVQESLEMFYNLYSSQNNLQDIIALCGLGEFLNQNNMRLSGGQRQRLLLAIAIVNQPEILFLDEPTTGLDPHIRQEVWALINQIKQSGTSVILSTHYMDEAEKLCDNLIFLHKGEIIAQDSPHNLLLSHSDGAIITLPRHVALPELPLENVTTTESGIEISSNNIAETMSLFIANNINLEGLRIQAPNLESVYLKLTGDSLEH